MTKTVEGDEQYRWLKEQRKSPYSESSPGLFELEAVEHEESSTVECRESGKLGIRRVFQLEMLRIYGIRGM